MFEVCHDSRPGGHAENQDACAVAPHPQDPACLLCAVADGQGGRAGGAAAARLACRVFLESASRRAPADLLRPEAWPGLLGLADRAVAGDPEAGFTTLVALAVRGDALCGASSGDSAAVAFSGGGPGVILTGRQHKGPPVGSGAARFVTFAARLRSPWTVLVLSDGVWKYAGWDSVLRAGAHASGADVLAVLRGRATLPGSGELPDDFTLVVIRG